MRRILALALFLAAPIPQDASPIGGVWTLNKSASELPRDIGFNPSWVAGAGAGDGSTARGGGGGSTRGRGGRGGGGGGSTGSAPPFAPRAESYDDARRLTLLNTDARNPPARLTIVDTPAAVTMTNELGQSRTLHPDGKAETIEIEGVPVTVTSKRETDRLIVTYRAAAGREMRYTYSVSPDPRRLVVDLEVVEHGTDDKARRVYDPGLSAPKATAPAAPATPPAAGGQPAGQPAPEKFDQRPGAELRGLTSLGILVEELSGSAVACGLNRDAIESALAKKLTAAGFSVRRNSDEDTYLYVNIETTSGLNGLCVSRYDAFLYTQATAKLTYHEQPVLVQVSLMHRGGIGSSVPSAHPPAVIRGLEGYVDLFITQIRDANK